MSTIVYHNPRCSKSRETIKLLEQHKIAFEPRLYLQDIPTKAELAQVISLLGFSSAQALMRHKEAIYKELKLATEDNEDKLLAAMVAHPKLIERPIVIVDNQQAKIGRPPESVLSLFE